MASSWSFLSFFFFSAGFRPVKSSTERASPSFLYMCSSCFTSGKRTRSRSFFILPARAISLSRISANAVSWYLGSRYVSTLRMSWRSDSRSLIRLIETLYAPYSRPGNVISLLYSSLKSFEFFAERGIASSNRRIAPSASPSRMKVRKFWSITSTPVTMSNVSSCACSAVIRVELRALSSMSSDAPSWTMLKMTSLTGTGTAGRGVGGGCEPRGVGIVFASGDADSGSSGSGGSGGFEAM
mmetsp:Transcript_16964/g.40904  ORF Transcript_16964/g.40904 Transcript_16964/m.40904 type:complete len:240 (-) Transcript_16964:655-1374(-)